jgi:hypothetical protein
VARAAAAAAGGVRASRNPKFEIRNPKSEIRKKSEARMPNHGGGAGFHLHFFKTTTNPFRISDFGLLSVFGDSDF